MSKTKKLFIFDLDGTLLNSQSKISKENISALLAAKSNGHFLTIATGRNFIYTQLALEKNWNLFDYYVGCNGAIIYKIDEMKIQPNNQKISYDLVQKLIQDVKNIGGTIQLSTEQKVFCDIYLKNYKLVINDYTKEKLFDPFPSISKMLIEDQNEIVHLSFHLEENNIPKYFSLWKKQYGNELEFTITSKFNIDVNFKDVSKLSALKEIIKEINVAPDNIFYFGDSQNDVKALEYFNNSYATNNALQDAKNAAKIIIGSNDSNDIAKVIMENI